MSSYNTGTPSAVEDEIASVKLLVKYFKSASGVITILITAFPLSGWLDSSLVPVWRGAPYLALALSFFTMMFIFFALHATSSNQIRSWRKQVVIWGVLSLVIYLCLNWLCIFEKDDARVVTGFFTTEAARDRVSQDMADSLARRDLLDSFGYDHAELAWKDARFIDVIINITFCTGCIGLSAGFFLCVLLNVVIDKEKQVKLIKAPIIETIKDTRHIS